MFKEIVENPKERVRNILATYAYPCSTRNVLEKYLNDYKVLGIGKKTVNFYISCYCGISYYYVDFVWACKETKDKAYYHKCDCGAVLFGFSSENMRKYMTFAIKCNLLFFYTEKSTKPLVRILT